MKEKELRERCGIGEKDLINTNFGCLDIFNIDNDQVTYGFLASGKTITESVWSFLDKMNGNGGKWEIL